MRYFRNSAQYLGLACVLSTGSAGLGAGENQMTDTEAGATHEANEHLSTKEGAMGLWHKLFGKPHPSDNWQAVSDSPIVLDMTRHALCDVRLRDPIEWFSKLGPPEDKKALKEGSYRYLSKGIEIGAEDGAVTDFTVVFAVGTYQPDFVPFLGSVVCRGRQLPPEEFATEEHFIRAFGEPYWRDEDDTEIILFYEFRYDIEWQAEFTLQRSLKSLLIVTPPLMSDEEQRTNYRVTKKWPPEYS